ncbi:MAG: hypothetical protein ACOY3H_05170 [Bacillota bacterium]|uniref:Uncharacterized protein n=2 Tax=Carboxydocella TaxID=178898 RepID=A0A1T4S5D0_9FIRM|nr:MULTISPECIES: hypothetical protein [Carboxydocella]AVX21195.1 hypothetical protein CFE_2029 [Carboxydocella thermautotrophica]AVX31629.1 hypothetical protein CTH_2064 [Carboxydocella thermautotrophica]SKA23031.1 hypothetical protein SAMN02745885_02429 [Carboxydocella sporoproducens DSM 16521]GAW29239.1 hypothetical protein ULO1_18090 [Carboxydocella sp. ULO1]GAW30253.1 hypothetical protein JDF658_00180 [Carboxydocella sp. JDF658]
MHLLFGRRREKDTFDFPNAGFWALHLATIPLVYMLGKMAGRDRE